MSYILDALKRADTERERERGAVPGLHSQNLPGGTLGRDRPRTNKRPASNRLLSGGALLSALLLAYAGWHFFGPTSPNTSNLVQGTVDIAPTAPPATPPREDPPAVQATNPAPPLAARPPELPILAPPPPAPPAPPPVASAPSSASPARSPAGTPVPATSAPTLNAPTAPTPSPATAPVRRFAELPADFRARLPQVNVSGSTYSSNPAQRTLIANGKMVQEGDEIAPGLKLESIGPRNAVLSYEGTRYSIGY